MKQSILLCFFLVHIAWTQSEDDAFLASLLGGADSSATAAEGGAAGPEGDQAFLDSLLGAGGDGPRRPKCDSVADTASLSDDAFLAALTGGCEESAEPEPGTPCERGEFRCTPYFRCNEADIVSDQLGLFDIRIGQAQFEEELDFITHSECPRFGDVCCTAPLAAPPAPATPPPYTPRCGSRHQGGVGARIVGFNDSESQFGEFPWMAAVLRVEEAGGEERRFFVCGGSLVHPQLVLTAAHCVRGQEEQRLVVRLGEWDTQNESEFLPHLDVETDGLAIHPGFDPRRLRDDVALLFLAEPVPLQEHIDTLCLPDPDVNYDGADCVASGWGKSAFEDGLFQTVLKQIDLPHVPRAPCQRALRKTRLGKYFRLDRSFTCAGGAGGRDTCTGDGGSPLACRDPANPDRYVQLGVVSWGVGCGVAGVPGVYADVRPQVGWIQQWARQVEQQQRERELASQPLSELAL